MPNIVLIGDKEERLSVIRELVDAGHRVVEASDGGQVIRLVNGKSDSLKIDAIIISDQSPKIYGSDAVSYFRITYPAFPLIALLESPDIPLANYYLEIGVKGLLVKPIEKEASKPKIG